MISFFLNYCFFVFSLINLDFARFVMAFGEKERETHTHLHAQRGIKSNLSRFFYRRCSTQFLTDSYLYRGGMAFVPYGGILTGSRLMSHHATQLFPSKIYRRTVQRDFSHRISFVASCDDPNHISKFHYYFF